MTDDLESRFPDIAARRADFPALARLHEGRPLAHFDGPGGTQVPQAVIDAVSGYYRTANANTHGFFATTVETDRMLHDARTAVADFLGAADARDISFGANMTTLAWGLAHAFARRFQPGDEVLVSNLDHEANRGPWLMLREHGMVVREIAIRPDATLDYDDFAAQVTPRTRLVAVGMASNAFGTVNDIARARELAYRAGAWLLVDAVHYAPHFPLDVRSLGVDFLLCSAYKFYGPHVGVLYSRNGLLDSLATDRLRTQDPRAPHRIETGTLNHAAIAGTLAAVDYLASLGAGASRRERVVAALNRVAEYERELAQRIWRGLQRLPAVTLVGPPFGTGRRAPTVSFVVAGREAAEVCRRLAERGICAWDGHFYAIRPIELLGLLERGGVTRVGISLYNSAEDVDRLLAAMAEIVAGA